VITNVNKSLTGVQMTFYITSKACKIFNNSDVHCSKCKSNAWKFFVLKAVVDAKSFSISVSLKSFM